MLLLAIDTSTPTVTAGVVSLARPHQLIGAPGNTGGSLPGTSTRSPVEVLAERSVTDAFAHAEQLMPLVQAALDDAGQAPSAVEAVVVGLGPGPFTGLRVGIATAQALGDALDLPVHGVGSHDAAARAFLHTATLQTAVLPTAPPHTAVLPTAPPHTAVLPIAPPHTAFPHPVPEPTDGPFLVVTDARRREVYLSGYAADGRRLLGPLPVAPTAVPALLDEYAVAPTVLVGAGAQLLAGLVEAPIAPAAGISVGLVLAAARALLTGAVPGPLTPLYLRRPDATEPGVRKSVLAR